MSKLIQTTSNVGAGHLKAARITLQMHDDEFRYRKYRQVRLGLSELGERVAERRDDISRRNLISRWWGGVKLTNDAL